MINLLKLHFNRWLLTLLMAAILVAACSPVSGGTQTLPTFTPRGFDSPTPTPDGVPFIPTLTPMPVGQLPGAIATYRLHVALDYLGHRAQVSAAVEVVNPGPDNWSQVVFQMPWALRSGSFFLNSITITKDDQTTTAQYQPSANLISVPLPQPLPPNDATTITFNYGLAANSNGANTRPPVGHVGYSAQVIQFINWYPVLVPYRAGQGWLAVGAGQTGLLPADPIYTDVADYELTVTAANDVTVASGGLASHENGVWKFSIKNGRGVIFSASPAYDTLTQSEGGVEITSYFVAQNAEAGRAALTAAAQALSLFVDRFGAYPYKTLVIAENAYVGSATGAGVVLHSGQGYADYDGRAESLLIATLPQAVARHWWGQVVTADSYAEPWLNEAVPMYAELIFDQAYQPELEDFYWQSRIDYWQPSGKLDRPAVAFGDTEDYLRNLLRRGAMFLHSVRQVIGDGPFYAFLQELYRSGAYRSITADDFFNTLRRYTSDTADLDPALAEYFSSRAMPTPAPTVTPAPTLTPTGSPAPTPVVHVVKSGETLTTIAQRYGVSVEAIVQANQLLNPDAIFVGQSLVIPTSSP